MLQSVRAATMTVKSFATRRTEDDDDDDREEDDVFAGLFDEVPTAPMVPSEDFGELCTLEAADLLSLTVPERNGLEEGPLITLDSGASNPVAHPDQFPGL